MRQLIMVIAAGLLMAGCSGGSTTTSATSSMPPLDLSTTPVKTAASTCDGFSTFYSDMLMYTPRGSMISDDADAMEKAAIRDASKIDRKLYDDVIDLVGYTGSSTWAHDGNVLSAQVVAVKDDCGQ